MKKFLLIFLTLLMCLPVSAKADTCTPEYLKEKKHFAVLNPIVEATAQRVIKKSLKKQTNGDYKVKFDGYTFTSMKKGIFKNLDIDGKDLKIEGIDIPRLKIGTISDYNWIDYTQKPPVMKSDMTYSYEIYLSEDSLNQALDKKEYRKTLEHVNGIAYPLFVINDVVIRLKNNKMYIVMEYDFPLTLKPKHRTFMVSTGFKVLNNKIVADNIEIDKSYGNLQTNKVSNLINLLDPLSFTLSILDKKKCNAKVENVKIVDNIIQINGKIFVKGD